MWNYFITYRIADKTVGGKTYDERRDMLIDNIYVEGGGFWDETTSFMIVSSDLRTHDFAAKAVRGLSEANDIVVVFDPTDMSMAHFGPIEYPAVLGSFFRDVKKLP